MVWKTLNRTYANQKRKPFFNDLNPKAVTNDELFGVINPATREWKDGLFSVIMREQANMAGDGPKWIVLGKHHFISTTTSLLLLFFPCFFSVYLFIGTILASA